MVMGIGLLIGIWLLVLANLLGLIDVVQSRYEDRATLLLGLVIGVPTAALVFALVIALTPLLIEKTAISYKAPTVIKRTHASV